MARLLQLAVRALRLPQTAAVLVASACCLCPALLRADTGTLRCIERVGNLRISVFTAPTPLRAGPAEISVLVQDDLTGEAKTAAPIELELLAPGGRIALPVVPTRATATNKLMQAAFVELTAPGNWHLNVLCSAPQSAAAISSVERAGRLELDLPVAPPLPKWLAQWAWFSWPLAVVGLFACHRKLAARAKCRQRG